MKTWIFQLILASLFVKESTATELDLRWVKEINEDELSMNEKTFTFGDAHKATSNLFPMLISFNNPVSNIQGPSLDAEMRNSRQWILTLNDTNSIDKPLSFSIITEEEKDVKILNIRVGDQMIYNDCKIKGSSDRVLDIPSMKQVTDVEISENETHFSFPDFGYGNYDLFPLRIYFDHPVIDVQGPSVVSEMLNPKEWMLSLEEDAALANSSTAETFSFKVLHEVEEKPKINSIRSGDFQIYQELDSLGGDCTVTAPLDLSPNAIVHCTATWTGGRNIQITLPSYDTYHGYIVDIFFTEPLSEVKVFDTSIKHIEVTPTHWSFLKDWTEPACIKLVKIFFQITSKEHSDIKALLLNGNSLFGNEKSAIAENTDIEKAVIDCDSFISTYAEPWFGNEIGVGLNFSTTLRSRNVMGVVMDIIFDDKVRQLKHWELTPSKVSDNHWRFSNAGYSIGENGIIVSTFVLLYNHHYHVKIRGIKVNNEVVCGLAAPPVYIVNKNNSQIELRMKSHLNRVNDMQFRIELTIVMVSFTILFSIIVPFIFVWIMNKNKTSQQLYATPVHSTPSVKYQTSTEHDDTYNTIDDSTGTNDTYISPL